jgi:hypothetical protein
MTGIRANRDRSTIRIAAARALRAITAGTTTTTTFTRRVPARN